MRNLYDTAVVWRFAENRMCTRHSSLVRDTETSNIWPRDILNTRTTVLEKESTNYWYRVDVRRRPLTMPNLFQEAVTTRRSSGIASRVLDQQVNFPR